MLKKQDTNRDQSKRVHFGERTIDGSKSSCCLRVRLACAAVLGGSKRNERVIRSAGRGKQVGVVICAYVATHPQSLREAKNAYL